MLKDCVAAVHARGAPDINSKKFCPGAGEGIRTPDPLITNQMLYQLSYASQSLPAPRDKG